MTGLRTLVVVERGPSGDAVERALTSRAGFDLETTAEPLVAVGRVQSGWPEAVVIVHRPPVQDAVVMVTALRKIDAEIPIVILAAGSDAVLATQALRLGVGDLLEDPPAPDALRGTLERLHHQRRSRQDAARQTPAPVTSEGFVGSSAAMRKVSERIDQVAGTDVDVLIRGETGTGKELVARALHERSRRAQRPFVAVDCGAIPENLLESEFFGHERGAFTGADARRIGLLEYADGGTFFLDEVGELPLLLQAKLLRSLQERKLRRVGGREEIKIDVRVVAATARPLEEMIREKTFREDLYYRINVVRIDLPPLRQRGDDLGLLAEHFAQRYSREMGKAVVGITPEAYQVLTHYRWPGNVRELQNVIRRGIALAHGSMIALDDLPDELVASAGGPQEDGSLNGNTGQGFFAERERHVQRFERDYLTELLRKHRGSVKAAAEEAQLPRGTLYRLMKNHNLDGDQFR